jgi:hypothetical protein
MGNKWAGNGRENGHKRHFLRRPAPALHSHFPTICLNDGCMGTAVPIAYHAEELRQRITGDAGHDRLKF